MTSFSVMKIFPPFWIFWKTYFFELLLGRYSDFHENWTRSSSDHADKKLWNSSWLLKPFLKKKWMNFTKPCENRNNAVSPQRFIVFRPKLVHVITSMTWGNMQRFGAVPPTGPEIRKIAIFAYNFWWVCPKIINLVSLDSGHHAESNDIQFSHICHFGCRPFWILC